MTERAQRPFPKFLVVLGPGRTYTDSVPTVLIVDDNEQNLYMLRILLETHGYRVVSALHGAEALDRARADLPDLVITDILMPVMDGFSFCREWMRDPVLSTKPFVFYTATYTGAKDEEFALSLGADRYLLKPQDPEILLEVVESLLGTAVPRAPNPEESETEFLKNYNLALFHKLEKKVADLEIANAALQKDMALRNELEKQLIQAQKMEGLGLMAGGIVHDFNNVLTAISGMASMVLASGGDGDQTREWVHKIQDAVRTGSALGRQLLAFARKQELTLVPLEVDRLLVETRPLLRAALPQGIDLVFSLAADLPRVRADGIQLKQVFLNLTTNAGDSMAPTGTLVVDTRKIALDEEFVRQRGGGQVGHFIRIRFQDTGMGIAPELLEKIFDPFFSTKTGGEGTGLGLSVVYGIVRQHQGFLQVTSVVGQGTCFEVYLPSV